MLPSDVFLWDDRSVHANAPGMGETGPTTPELCRAACYVTMSRRDLASEEAIETRRLGYQRSIGNGHPAHHPLPRSRFEAEKDKQGGGWGSGVEHTEEGTPLNAFQRSLVPI